jgi:hypothetical protein
MERCCPSRSALRENDLSAALGSPAAGGSNVRLVRLTRGFLAGQALSDSRPPEGMGVVKCASFLTITRGCSTPIRSEF